MQPIPPLGRLPLGSYSDLAVTFFSSDGRKKEAKRRRRFVVSAEGSAHTYVIPRRRGKTTGSQLKFGAFDVHQNKLRSVWDKVLI